MAALTVPSIIINYQKKIYVTQLKKAYNNANNAFRQLMAKDGVTQLTDTKLWSLIPSEGLNAATLANNPELREEFNKVFITTGIYTSETKPEQYMVSYKHLKCSPSSTKCVSGSDTASINLNDGNSTLYFSLNKEPSTAPCGSHRCTSLKEFQTFKNTPTKCWQKMGNFQIDVNGPKKPNIWGRDFFQFALGNDGVLYPYQGIEAVCFNACSYSSLSSCSYYWKSSSAAYDYSCTLDSDKYSSGKACSARIMEEGWQMNY